MVSFIGNKHFLLVNESNSTNNKDLKTNFFCRFFIFLFSIQLIFLDTIKISCFNNSKLNTTTDFYNKKINIAIIGSGIGGLSTAYYLKKNKFLKINKIDIFERKSRLGGRIYSQKIFNRTENLGASFFIKKNQLISNLIQELDLKIISTVGNGDNSFALFEDKKLNFSIGNYKVINIIKMLWRYGFSIVREKMLMRDNLEKFNKIYEALNSGIIFSDVRQLINYMGLDHLVAISLKEYLISKGVNIKYIDEFANLFLKIIYNQQNDVNAFAGFITLIGASFGSYKIEGGNSELIKKLSEKLLEKKETENKGSLSNSSNIKINIIKNAEVFKIEKKEKNFENIFEDYTIHYKILESNNKQLKKNYDIVILASPLEFSKIVFPKEFDLTNTDLIPKESFYYFLKGKIKETKFGLDSDNLPSLLISYNITSSNNIMYIRKIGEGDYKISSDEELNDEILKDYFESGYKIEFINHWKMAYPKLNPRKVDTLPTFQIEENFFYLNAIESIGSCMELSMISAKNIVNLIENKFHPFKETKHYKSDEL